MSRLCSVALLPHPVLPTIIPFSSLFLFPSPFSLPPSLLPSFSPPTLPQDEKGSNVKAKVALDTITEIKMVSLHDNIVSITLAQLMRPVMGQNGSCALCAMSEANFLERYSLLVVC